MSDGAAERIAPHFTNSKHVLQLGREWEAKKRLQHPFLVGKHDWEVKNFEYSRWSQHIPKTVRPPYRQGEYLR